MVKKTQQYYVFLQTVGKKSWHLTNYPQTILVCCDRKWLDFLHHCVVWSRLLQGESPAGNTCEVRIQNNLGLRCQPLNRSITLGVCENRRTLCEMQLIQPTISLNWSSQANATLNYYFFTYIFLVTVSYDILTIVCIHLPCVSECMHVL